MAEGPKITRSDDGLYVRYEFDAHYISDEDAKRIRGYIDQLQAENANLRELAVLNWEWAHRCCGNNCKMQTDGCGYGIDRECNYEREIYDRMRDLGVEVDR